MAFKNIRLWLVKLESRYRKRKRHASRVNGTLVSTGGFEGGANTAKYLVNYENCVWKEYPKALAARRWYSTQATLPAGTFIVVGGRDALNYEYILPEEMNNKKLYDSQLLRQTDDPEKNNLCPFVWLNTDGDLFIFANNRSKLLSPKTNKSLVKEITVAMHSSGRSISDIFDKGIVTLLSFFNKFLTARNGDNSISKKLD
ncbi:hypothetical protein EUTSA_v10019163mg [Eutrema salsugineum]|uniref:Glyoxal oxidase N-terminal domain-containing protein n=1 Tax=Eutrema salsugineum TaxID=72664 RepID=V4JTF4_EUTSA|nr:hypothetical protein EUTSA_v10019163mg [Eutrema salsugineum]